MKSSRHAAFGSKTSNKIIVKNIQDIYSKSLRSITAGRIVEDADSVPLQDGPPLPDEISRRTQRKAKLEAARQAIQEQFEERQKKKVAEYGAKLAERRQRLDRGESIRGPKLKEPSTTPEDKAHINFIDPDSRIMKAGNGKHYEQAHNAQAAVDTEGHYLILGQRVTNNPNDKEELVPDVASVPAGIREVDTVLADTGFFSENAVKNIEADDGPTPYVAAGKTTHHKTVADLEKRPDPPAPGEDASPTEIKPHRLQTENGRKVYALRKHTEEPVFGIIKEAIGFRQFHLRGHPKVETEWTLVTLAYNMKRLFNMAGRCSMPE